MTAWSRTRGTASLVEATRSVPDGALPVGHRLIPGEPFILGGEFHSDNVASKPDVAGMRIRAQLWRLTKDLPEGATISFRVQD